jgi:hypothetical protein
MGLILSETLAHFGKFLFFDSREVTSILMTLKVALCQGSLDYGYGWREALHVC